MEFAGGLIWRSPGRKYVSKNKGHCFQTVARAGSDPPPGLARVSKLLIL